LEGLNHRRCGLCYCHFSRTPVAGLIRSILILLIVFVSSIIDYMHAIPEFARGGWRVRERA